MNLELEYGLEMIHTPHLEVLKKLRPFWWGLASLSRSGHPGNPGLLTCQIVSLVNLVTFTTLAILVMPVSLVTQWLRKGHDFNVQENSRKRPDLPLKSRSLLIMSQSDNFPSKIKISLQKFTKV